MEKKRIGVISTRLAGTDGVSLETIKWVQILEGLGHECFYFAGELDYPEERSHLAPEAHFFHPEIEALNRDLFDASARSPEVSRKVQQLKDHLKVHLYQFLRRFNLDLIIVENALTLPMNVPLGLALVELIAETDIPTIAHHHDFAWERTRFAITGADDYIRTAFPPILRSIHHVVINSFAARQLALRTGASSMLIPNVMDFESPPPAPGEYAADLREALSIDADELMLLQPTRIVPRKRIEQAINLARRLERRCVLVISHASGDEGSEYEAYLRDYARAMGVRVLFAADRIAHDRGRTAEGRKIYSLGDAYHHADLVTYPSVIEGFGNAFLETLYFRKPIVMSTYEIFKTDIQPKGFRVVGFDEFITETTVSESLNLLDNPALVEEIVEHNYELGRMYYSYRVLEEHLIALLGEM